MNEKEIIKKLQLLKSIQPQQTMLDNLKEDIYQDIRPEGNRKIVFEQKLFTNSLMVLKSYTYISFSVVFAILIAISWFMLSGILQKTILYSRLATAPNQYEKAYIALADTKSRFGTSNVSEAYNISDLSESIALTNTELSKLKLKGVKGQYTSQQCRQLYKAYLNYLEQEKLTISHDNKQSVLVLKSQINTDEELAEHKLEMYK